MACPHRTATATEAAGNLDTGNGSVIFGDVTAAAASYEGCARCRCIEMKTSWFTCPGSPGYTVVQDQAELPELPAWIAELFGKRTARNASTGCIGWSDAISPELLAWAKSPGCKTPGQDVLPGHRPECYIRKDAADDQVVPPYITVKPSTRQNVKSGIAAHDPAVHPRPIRDKRASTHRNHRGETPEEAFFRRAHSKFCAVKHPNTCDIEICVKSALPPELFTYYQSVYLRLRDGRKITEDDQFWQSIDPDGSLGMQASSTRYPLLAVRNGIVELLPDPDPPRQANRYPGWTAPIPQGRLPMPVDDRARLFAAAALERGDNGLGGNAWTVEFNSEHAQANRAHPIAYNTGGRDAERAVEMGLVHVIRPAEKHRRGQSWYWTQPVYAAGPTPPDRSDFRRHDRPRFEPWMVLYAENISSSVTEPVLRPRWSRRRRGQDEPPMQPG